MPTFGAIVSGRAVQTDFQQVDPTRFLITITDADSVNHVVVFLIESLPVGYAAGVYFSWPDPNIPPTWMYLGYISNEKPSAIFKITKLKSNDDSSPTPNIFGYTQPIVSHVAQIGISVEPIAQIQQMTPDPSASPSADSFLTFATKTAENLFNYVMSFGRSIMPNGGGEQFVPVSTIQQWFEIYVRKLQQDPNFWKN